MAEGARLESVCILTGTEGSNPSLSVIAGPCAICYRPTPSGPEGSSGKRLVNECSKLGIFIERRRYVLRIHCRKKKAATI